MTRRILFKRLFGAYVSGSLLSVKLSIVKPKHYDIHIKEVIMEGFSTGIGLGRKYHIHYASINGGSYRWYKADLIYKLMAKLDGSINLTIDDICLEGSNTVERLS